jgi:GNAT superfamily N-acetyltransferase
MKKSFLTRKRRSFQRLTREGRSWDILEAILANLKKLGIYIQVNRFYRCDSISHSPRKKPEDITIRSLGTESIPLLIPLEGKEGQVFHTRLKDYGDECRGIFRGDDLAGYVWLSDLVMRIPELEFERPLRADEVYMYDVFIGKNWRNRGLYSLFLDDLLQSLLPAGKTVYTSVEITNYRARRANTRMGFARTGRGILTKIGRWRCWRSIKINFNVG